MRGCRPVGGEAPGTDDEVGRRWRRMLHLRALGWGRYVAADGWMAYSRHPAAGLCAVSGPRRSGGFLTPPRRGPESLTDCIECELLRLWIPFRPWTPPPGQLSAPPSRHGAVPDPHQLDEQRQPDPRVRARWKWQLKKGPLRPREKGPPVGSVSTSTLLRHGETAHPGATRREPAVPDPNPEPAVPVRCGVRRSVARRVPGTLWTVGTRASRPGRKAHNCHPSRGAGGVSPEGP